jgi:hypothetical protein
VDNVQTSRRGMLGALAIATPAAAAALSQFAEPAYAGTVDRAAWDRAKFRYEARLLHQEAVEKLGYLHVATDDRKTARYIVAELSGVRDAYMVTEKSHPHLATRIRAADRANERWAKECVEPLDQAAIALLLTPAPDLEAVKFKFAMIERHELHEWTMTPRDCAEVIRKDLVRIGGLR